MDLTSQQVAQQDWATPHCGGLNISAPKQVQTCDNGNTLYHAVMVVSTQSGQRITTISADSDVDNSLTLELIGNPYLSNQCASPYFCFWQNYYAYPQSPKTATIKYDLSITCGGPPPDALTVPQAFACK